MQISFILTLFQSHSNDENENVIGPFVGVY